MLHDLEQCYREQGIYSEDFRCRHKDECSKHCENFTEARSAFVGTQYERGILPRLMFLSLDPGSGRKDPSQRTPYAVRKEVEELNGRKIGRYQHWRETHRLAVVLLQQFDPDISLETVTPYFCHVNSAKCTENKRGNAEAKRLLFDNCWPYLQEEVTILMPSVIVTQGVKAAYSLWRMLDEVSPIDFGITREVLLKGKTILWIKTYHPSARQRFRDEKNRWPEFALSLKDFVNRRKQENLRPLGS